MALEQPKTTFDWTALSQQSREILFKRAETILARTTYVLRKITRPFTSLLSRCRADVAITTVIFVGFMFLAIEWREKLIGGSASLDVHTKISEILRNYGLGMAGLFAATYGVMLAWRRTNATMEQARIAQESQFTELFTKAIEQLGNKQSMELRLGAIYALERIAKNSRVDHWPIMEILMAYLRENSKWNEDADAAAPGADVQAIVTVLARRNTKFEKGGMELDLRYVNLREINFSLSDQSQFENTLFVRANLRSSYFSGANLKSAKFNSANLRRARFVSGCVLEDSNFSSTDLTNARISFSNLKNVDLVSADLRSAAVLSCNLEAAELTNSSCEKSRFSKCNMRNAILLDANFTGARMQYCDLTGAQFGEEAEDGTSNVTLYGATLTGSRGLTEEQMKYALTDDKTVLPRKRRKMNSPTSK